MYGGNKCVDLYRDNKELCLEKTDRAWDAVRNVDTNLKKVFKTNKCCRKIEKGVEFLNRKSDSELSSLVLRRRGTKFRASKDVLQMLIKETFGLQIRKSEGNL